MNRYALIIGINKYISQEISPLLYAANDANELSNLLLAAGEFKVPYENQFLLIDTSATRQNIIKALNELVKNSDKDDIVIFYYSGHGCSTQSSKGDPDDSLQKYIVPFDTDVHNLDSSAIDFNFLAERLNHIRSKSLIMIFDCCYSGAAGGRTFQIPGIKAVATEVGKDYLNKVSGSGRVVMTACDGIEVAKEISDFRHGLFTNFIIEGLKGEADYTNDSLIDVDELWMFARKSTINYSNSQQNPVRTGWTTGDAIYLNQTRTLLTTRTQKDELSKLIIKKFGKYKLQEILIADQDNIISIGAEAARYLDTRLQHGTKIAVSCGRTLIATINQMSQSKLENIEIYPLNGSPTPEVRLTHSIILSYLLWSKFESDTIRTATLPTGLPIDFFEKYWEELSVPIKRILSEAKEADMFLFGIGSPTKENKNIGYLLGKANLTPEQVKEMGAAGELNYHLYDKFGKLLVLNENLSDRNRAKIEEYNSKFLSISPNDLLEVTKRPGISLIAIAGGREKWEPIAAGIRGRFVRTLITDINTADWLANKADNGEN